MALDTHNELGYISIVCFDVGLLLLLLKCLIDYELCAPRTHLSKGAVMIIFNCIIIKRFREQASVRDFVDWQTRHVASLQYPPKIRT